MQSQFDHLSETYFNNFEYDLGERELGYALSFDHDLEMFAASVGLIKTSVAAVLKDDGQCWYIVHVYALISSHVYRRRGQPRQRRSGSGLLRAVAEAS